MYDFICTFTQVFDLCSSLMVACDTGRWGLDCVSVCDCGNSDGGCDAQTGRCHCEAGFTGPRCDQSE